MSQRAALRFGVLLAVILVGGLAINCWSYLGEAHVERSELKNFPAQIGPWQKFGGDGRFDKDVEVVLRADDYLLRDYRRSDGRVASFYVGYYATQRNGASYHSPLNCLPGTGWTMSEAARVMIKPTDGSAEFEANRYLIQSGNSRQALIYWYQGRGRAVASEYWGKVYTVLDSLRRRRSDGAMVRVTVPVQSSDKAALEAAEDLAANLSAVLSPYIPD